MDSTPTFSQIGSGGSAEINGADIRMVGGKFDMIGTPAMLNYLSELSVTAEKRREEAPSDTSVRGIIFAIQSQTKTLEAIAQRLEIMDVIINNPSPKVDVVLPELRPHITVTPAETASTGFKIPWYIKAVIALVAVEKIIMLISDYQLFTKLFGPLWF